MVSGAHFLRTLVESSVLSHYQLDQGSSNAGLISRSVNPFSSLGLLYRWPTASFACFSEVDLLTLSVALCLASPGCVVPYWFASSRSDGCVSGKIAGAASP